MTKAVKIKASVKLAAGALGPCCKAHPWLVTIGTFGIWYWQRCQMRCNVEFFGNN